MIYVIILDDTAALDGTVPPLVLQCTLNVDHAKLFSTSALSSPASRLANCGTSAKRGMGHGNLRSKTQQDDALPPRITMECPTS